MLRYEVYFDESGEFKNDSKISLVAGFAIPLDANQSEDCLKLIVKKCVEQMNIEGRGQRKPPIVLGDNREEIHTTISDNEKSDFLKAKKQWVRNWVTSGDRFSQILATCNATITMAYGWPDEVANDEFALEGFYRHMLRSLMQRVTMQLRARHPGQELDITFCIPTRTVRLYGDQKTATRDFERIGLKVNPRSGGYDINLSQAFLQAQEDMGVRCVCRKIEYSKDTEAEDKATESSSWGYYLADWVCALARKHVSEKNNTVDQVIKDLSLRQSNPERNNEPIVIVYNEVYRRWQSALKVVNQDPLAYLDIYTEAAASDIDRTRWCANLMKAEHPFTDSRLLQETIQQITCRYNSPENPFYEKAMGYYQQLKNILDGSDNVSSAAYAELCKYLLICHQHHGANSDARKAFDDCWNSDAEWATLDMLDIFNIYSETYINVMGYEEALEMLEWALENFGSSQEEELSNSRWMRPRPIDENRLKRLQGEVYMSMGTLYGYLEERGKERIFKDAIELLEKYGKPEEADIARSHLIHYLLMFNENDDQVATEMNIYISGQNSAPNLKQSNTWKAWLDQLMRVYGNKGVDDIRFPLWLYLKALYRYWDNIDGGNNRAMKECLFKNEATKAMLNKVISIDYHPVESIIIYYGLLASDNFDLVQKMISRLTSMAQNRNGIIPMICRVGILKIKLRSAGAVSRDLLTPLRPGIKNDIRSLASEWRDIRTNGARKSRIDKLSELTNNDAMWMNMKADKLCKLLSYEFN